MSKRHLTLITGYFITIIGFAVVSYLSAPRRWPMEAGSIKARKVAIDGEAFVRIDGDSMNYLAQIQSVSIELDASSKRITVRRCRITMNPFSNIMVNNQFPVFYPLEGLNPGAYSICYEVKDGVAVSERLDVP